MADKPIFDEYLSRPYLKASECAFSNLFIWKEYCHTTWCVSHGFLLVKIVRKENEFFLPPLGGDPAELHLVIEEMKEYTQGRPIEIHGVYEATKATLLATYSDLEFIEDRDNWDYIYLREKLASLSGRKYHGQKNHFNAFKKAHPDYSYEPMSAANLPECLAFSEQWFAQRMVTDPTIIHERDALHMALRNFDALGLRGGALRINGKIEAFSYGTKINEDTAVLHVEKANVNIRGLYVAINKEFAEHGWQDVVYLNREEDMGMEGLRKAKEDLHPEMMWKKYSVFIK